MRGGKSPEAAKDNIRRRPRLPRDCQRNPPARQLRCAARVGAATQAICAAQSRHAVRLRHFPAALLNDRPVCIGNHGDICYGCPRYFGP